MFSITGDYGSDFKAITDSFLEITKNDPIITSKEGDFTSHDHGWGYVLHDEENLDFFRSKTPVFDTTLPLFSSGNLVMHARKAASGEPMGTLACHPHFESDNRYEVFLAHNGWFDKKAIAQELDLNGFENLVDSQMFLKYIMTFQGEFKNRLESALLRAKSKSMIKTTANLMILAIDRNTGHSTIYYYTDIAEREEYTNYVKLYSVKGENWTGVFSSSIIVPSYFPGRSKATEVKRGVVHIL